MKKGFAPPPKGGSCLRAAGRLFLNGEEAVHSRTLQVVRKPVAAMNSPGSVIWPTRMSWQLADTIVAVDTNALETQTNY